MLLVIKQNNSFEQIKISCRNTVLVELLYKIFKFIRGILF